MPRSTNIVVAFVRSFRMGLMYALRWFPCVRWESGLTYADYLRQLKSGTVMTTTQHYSRGPSNEGDDRLLQVRLPDELHPDGLSRLALGGEGPP